jgi:tetrapyrrole methylase family protein/MazG family protein
MARLRGPEGCPWDREQTHESLEVHLQEEAHEVIDAIDRGLVGDELEEELGDVLLQVAFHAQLAADDGRFDLAGVAHRVTSKLVHRHPHVFADTQVADSDEVTKNWESLKAEEKQRSSLFDDIPPTLPSLLMAYKVQKRAASRGFTADAHKAASEVAAALQGPVDAGSLGDALFWLVASARAAGIDPEGALRHAILRFKDSL